jgi:hypothetical protein
MKTDKLFSLLVLGGALLASNGPKAQSATDKEGKAPVFCDKNDTNMCVPDGNGGKKVKQGLYCCWGTTCD